MSDLVVPADVIFNSKWRLTFDTIEREDGDVVQAFLIGPGRSSSSLNFALECGTTSCDEELQIPPTIMKLLKKYEEYA